MHSFRNDYNEGAHPQVLQALLKDGLYFDLARHANEMAFRLRDGIAAR